MSRYRMLIRRGTTAMVAAAVATIMILMHVAATGRFNGFDFALFLVSALLGSISILAFGQATENLRILGSGTVVDEPSEGPSNVRLASVDQIKERTPANAESYPSD